MAKMRVKAKVENGVTTVKALISHPMETGQRKDPKTGKKFPAHFITEVNCMYGEKNVMQAYWSGGISKNPYLNFQFTGGEAGQTLTLSWKDNNDQSESLDVKLS